MPNKIIVSGLLCFGFSLFGGVAGADEVLGHISDETEPAIQQPAAENANSDRKIIYRVICSPADEQLPDCEKPFHDVEADNKPQQPSHDDNDQARVDEQQSDSANEEKPAPPQPAKPALKAANKKPDKSSKKPAGKKDKPTLKASATQKAGKKDAQKPAAKKPAAKKK